MSAHPILIERTSSILFRGAAGKKPILQTPNSGAQVKHFIAYSVEVDTEHTSPQAWCGSPLNEGGDCALPNDRHSLNAHVSRQDLIETYAPAFQAAADAKAGAIMCSYNLGCEIQGGSRLF